MVTEVLSIRVRKELKDQADELGIDVKQALEEMLEEMIEVKKRDAKNTALKLSRLMSVTVEEWVNDTRKIRHES